MDDDTISSENGDALQVLITNGLQYHMNDAAANLPDERDFIRTWRRRLRDVLQNEHSNITRFLVRNTEDLETVQRHDRLLHELSDPFVNINSEWLRTNTNPIVNSHEVLNTLQHDIMIPIESLNTGIRNAMIQYSTTIRELFETESALHKKLRVIEQLQEWIRGIPVSDSEEFSQLQTALFEYIKSTYRRNDIQYDYKRFCTLFARFTALRSIITPLQSTDATGSPICSICTGEKVTYTVIPCGHTFCNSCCYKQRSQCYICRNIIRDRQRIYFS